MSTDNQSLSKSQSAKLSLKHNSPHIFFGLGIAGIIAGNILSCRATLGMSDKLDRMKDELDDVKANSPEEDRNRDLALVYKHNLKDLAKAYAPSVLVTGLSIAALSGSHVQLTRRNAALTAAYSSLMATLTEYRQRVATELGEDKEEELYQGFERDNKGNLRLDPENLSVHARFFDEASEQWQKDPELNRVFLQCQQEYLNQLLRTRGHVFLNEVYDALGLERTKAGQVVGWILTDDGSANYIDMGIFDIYSSRFVNGSEACILLDFNVNGVIYDKI